ncbi:site-specific integrase [Altererythrobacter sp. RZ02]|uniref:Site-specific integrase n=1 Tax=Pontixanthobacter rizhaonensis TaxID=2730337 RepID=A0A848QH69_9SPHN|nr:site-specific integrase [Pontixanthobacter rizhaonensis]NMW33021.1 site-specific integrase [Pontixanthobacter rizhaonensis]
MSIGLTVDPTLLQPLSQRSDQSLHTVENSTLARRGEVAEEKTISVGAVLERFLADPTQDWSPRTRLAYETTSRFMISMIGASTPIGHMTRAACREFLETLRFLPKNASRSFPDLTPKQASDYARSTGYENVISPSNANIYINKVCVVLNWAVREGYLERNHLKGLRLADPIARVDKRLPFSHLQLEAMFNAPLFTGCQDDELGYAKAGGKRPRGTRFWVILIALYTGMRLNEICQLDTADVRAFEGIACFSVSERSLVGTDDKHLKTRSSERVVPIHPDLLSLGILDFVEQRNDAGHDKLFFDICAGQDGFRSTAFSKWFVLFLIHAKAREPKTSFHSFRHLFRDALRQAKVSREIAMILGGWGTGTKSGLDVADYYGKGFEISVLAEAIEKLSFDHINALRALITSSKR